MNGSAPEIAEVEISAHATGTREVQALQAELTKLNLSTVELNKKQQAFVRSTVRQAEAFGKTRAELAALRAEQLGLGQQMAPVIQRWREAEVAGSKAFKHVGHAARDAEQGIKGFLSHGGVMRELIVLFHESVIMGNYSRFGGSLMVLAERANIAHYMFTAMAGGIAAAAGALVTLGAAFVEGERESLAFGRALQMTGGYAGITEGQFNSMAETIGREIPGSVGSAREAMLALMRTGAFSGEALMSVTRAAVLFSEVTGEKSAKVVTDFAKMDMGVAKWAAHANQSYHFLSLAQYDYIRQLEQEGHKEKAEQVTADALYNSLGRNAPRNLGYLMEAWYGVRDAVAATWDAMKNIGRTETLADRISNVKSELAKLNDRHLAPGALDFMGLGGANRAKLQAQLSRLEAEQIGTQTRAVVEAHQKAVQAKGIAAEGHLTQFRQSMLKGPDLARQHVNELRQWVKEALAADPMDPTALAIKAHWSDAVAAIDHRYIHSTGSSGRGATSHHGSAAAAREGARFNTLLREEAANLKNAQAALKAEQGHLTASATAHKILNQQLQLEAWARKEIARYPDKAAAINAFVAQQKGMLPTMPAAQAPPNTGRAGTEQAFSSFVSSQQNVAGQVEAIWKKTWGGFGSALTTALTGGRVNFRAFAAGIFKDMTSMVVKDAIMAPMASMLGGALGLKTPHASAAGFLEQLLGVGAAVAGGGSSRQPGASAMGGMGTPGVTPTGGGSLLGSAYSDVRSGLGFLSTASGIASLFKGKTMLGSAAHWIASIAGFANGGIMTPGGPLPLNRYANGGVANSPQVALFGEGRMPEAYVPLPDGRAIPVQMRGGGGGNVFHLNTTIHHSGAPGFDPQQAAREMHQQLIHMMQREVIRQKRDGGLLATNGTAPA